MFGLTKREQRWKAEQRAMETVLKTAVEIATVAAAARLAELEAENAKLREELWRVTGSSAKGAEGE